MNTWDDTFQAADNTVINTGGYTPDSGGSYANLTGQTAINCKVESHSPYSATPGQGALCVYSVPLGLNDPIEIPFSIGGPTSGDLGVPYRIDNSTGACYYLDFSWTSGFFNAFLAPSYESLFNFTLPTLSTGSYTLDVCPFYSTCRIYLRNGSGQWCNPAGTFQAAKIAMISYGSEAIMTAGLAGFAVSSQSVTHPIVVASVSGGPAVMLPTELAAPRVSDTYVDLYCVSSEGGYAPLTYTLQRSTGGSYSNVGVMIPGEHYYDATVAASTSYTYRVAVTDAQSNTVNSNIVSVTTLAGQSITPYTLGLSPLTFIQNGAQWEDTSTTLMVLFHHQASWDQRYGQYFVTADTSSTDQSGASLGFWASTDCIKWTPQGSVVSGTTILGTTYDFISCLGVMPHPTDGHYYAFFQANSGTHAFVFIYKGTTPLGAGTTHVAGPIQPPLVNDGGSANLVECCWYLDPLTATAWLFYSINNAVAGTTYQSSFAVPLNSTWDAFGSTASLLSPLDGNNEVPAPFRKDRIFYVGCSYDTVNYWNPNIILVGTDPTNTGSTTGPFNRWGVIPNSTVFTSAAQQIAAPAGAVASGNESAGFGGFVDVNYKRNFEGYKSGTAPGVDPLNSYASQVFSVFETSQGQWIWCAIRWNAAGNNPSTCWFPIAFDASLQPTIPFAATFVPIAQPSQGPGVAGRIIFSPGSATFAHGG